MKPEKRFAAALAKLAAVYRVTADDVLVEAYWEALREWPVEALEAAAREWIKAEKWMPKPVEWADFAQDWLLERRRIAQAHRLALAESNAPALTRGAVRKLVDDLVAKLGVKRA